MNTQQFDPIQHRASIISISWNSVFNSRSTLRMFGHTAGWQFDPIIGRIQRAAGRASSASAGTPFLNSPSHLLAFEHTAVRPNPTQGEHHQHQLELSFSTHAPLYGCLDTQQGGCSTQSQGEFSEPQGEHHQHQLELSFSTHAPLYGCLDTQQGGSSTQSLDEFSEPQGEHHQHQLELRFSTHPLIFWRLNTQQFDPIQHRASIISISWNSVFQLTLRFTGVWTHSRVAVPPNHWTNSANSRASIISISFLNSPSHLLAFAHTAVRPNPTQGEHHQHQLELRFSTHAPIYARLDTPQGSSSTQSLGEFRTAGRASSASAGTPFLNSPSHLLAFEHTAVLPNPTQGEHHQHQLELRC